MHLPASTAVAKHGYAHPQAYRYERKFLVDDLLSSQVEAIIKLHPRLFYSPYPPRFVNNLYFDTPDMENYYDNINGASNRRKVRVRWYGAPFGEINKPILEIKVKEGPVGTKHAYPLPPSCLDERFCNSYFKGLVMHSSLPENVRRDLLNQEVVLFNRYYRRYYASRDGHFRVTLDSMMTFYKANSIFGNTFMHRQVNEGALVVELKYDVAQESQANRVASYFPFRVTRNSKYVQGIERVYF